MLPTVAAAFVFATTGCGPGTPKGAVAAPTSAPTTASSTSDATESFRRARADDLRILIGPRTVGKDGFPLASVQVWNNGGDDVIVEYAPGSVVLHCGPYEQHGPDLLLGRRREILEPQQDVDFAMPRGKWSRSPATTGPQDLMLPTELEKGKYPLWATFRVTGPGGEIVESDHDTYEVP